MFAACGLVSRSLIAELNPSRRRFVVPIPALVGGITRIMTKVLHESVWAAHESAVVTLYGNGEDRRLVDDEGRVTRTRSRKTQARGSRREYATTTNTYGASCVWDNRPELAHVRDPTLVSQPSPPFVPPPAPWPDVQPAPQPERRLPVATRLPAHLPATERWSHAPIITCTTCLMPLSRHLTHHHLVHPSVPSTAGLACPPNHHDAGKFLADNTLAHHLVTGEPIPWVTS
ncbi:hypothetical protein BCR44DRAFT_290518 [Catenaria anguillulae PL171]|uniref:Uncharacterized protein n=1 Tax=Catenaria anguillulae PL171 TaxID=765915 RepID=A0A1Y2H3X7_9FUNG|nr:hypothetical protein BCR44DRAFT_290518 [Catenaria anguillulae PL171]